MRWIDKLAVLASLSVACSSAAEEVDAGSAAQEAADVVSSINDRQLDYSFHPTAFEEPMLAFAGLSASVKKPGNVDVTTSLFRLLAKDYTLSATADSGDTNDVVADVPANNVTGGVPRLMLFVSRDGFKELASPDGVTLFERVTIEGEAAIYEAVLTSGEPVIGRIELPGLVAGSTQYGFAVLPRNVPSGSIFGTHFFKVKVDCKTADCAMAAHRR